MFWKGKEPDRAEVAKMLENFLRGTAGDWDWDDYIQGMEYSDSTLEGIRQRARLLGGACRILSNSGKGTRICVTLPVLPKEKEA